MDHVVAWVIIPALWVVPFVWCALLLVRPPRATPSFGRRIAMGIGWQALWTMPLLPAQLLLRTWLWPRHSFEDGSSQVLFLYFPWLVHAGGATVTTVFDGTAKAITGHRESTLMDNLHVFAAMTLVQLLLVSAVLALRYRATRRLSDPVLVALGLLVLLNGALSLRFPWWGT